ncbi:MAG: hypothetical protein HDQ88_03950 [Clostridia bacterium]|nr:hypothetical protein [Clostridia bacterium]
MRNKSTHSVTLKKKLNKCRCIFYAYNDLQYKYGEYLDGNNDIAEIKCNVSIDECELGDTYTTDFYCVKTNGDILVRECVYKEKLLRPQVIKMLDASRNYWLSKGINDWGIVLNESK